MKTDRKFTPEQELQLRPYGKRPGGWLIDSPKIPMFSPVCTYCSHYQLNRQCRAFPTPESIPMEIWLGHNPHTSPFPGDHGIQFEPVNCQQTQCQPDIVQASSASIGESEAYTNSL